RRRRRRRSHRGGAGQPADRRVRRALRAHRHPRERCGRQPQRQDLGDEGGGLGLRTTPEFRPTFLCTRAAVPHMMRRRSGRIICMSSGAREGTPWTAYYAGGSAYSAAKAGVHGFVRDVALELAEYGITVNAVAPGPIDTERFGPGLKKLNET